MTNFGLENIFCTLLMQNEFNEKREKYDSLRFSYFCSASEV